MAVLNRRWLPNKLFNQATFVRQDFASNSASTYNVMKLSAGRSAMKWCCKIEEVLDAEKGHMCGDESHIANQTPQLVPQYSMAAIIGMWARLQLL